MKKLSFSALAVGLMAVGFLTGAWVTWRTSVKAQTQTERKVLYWVDPMHPSYKSDKPGIAPDCGMQLEPVYADDPSGAVSPAPGAVRVADDKRQLIGVRTGIAEARRVDRVVRTVGRVAVDEARLYRIVSASEGTVRQIFDYSTGNIVRKDDLLLSFLPRDPEFARAISAYYYALDIASGSTKAAISEQQLRAGLRTATDTLVKAGMGERQLAELATSRKTAPDIEVRSPVAGFVVARNVSAQQWFDRGSELYRIADLSRVWILVDLFENEGRDLRPGTVVRISRGQTSFNARVSNALPQFDSESRTMKVRLEADNHDYSMRPGMFVDAEVPVSLPQVVTVPIGAVLDSGSRKTVFVDRGNGYFEPRRVQTGATFDGRIEIVSGLSADEPVALSGTFLLDSESRMKAAASGISNPVTDPVCGMEVDEGKARAAGKAASHRGTTYYFCSDDCLKKFGANPGAYLK